jgi:hypothetical protein
MESPHANGNLGGRQAQLLSQGSRGRRRQPLCAHSGPWQPLTGAQANVIVASQSLNSASIGTVTRTLPVNSIFGHVVWM